MQLTQRMKDDLKTLEGRDLMYFLLDLHQNSYIDGDNITSFLEDNLSERSVKDFIQEATND